MQLVDYSVKADSLVSITMGVTPRIVCVSSPGVTHVYRDGFMPLTFKDRDAAVTFMDENLLNNAEGWVNAYGAYRKSVGWEWRG